MNYEEIYKEKDQRYYNHSRPEIISFIDFEISSALDVGCGTGNFGLMLKKKLGCRVVGIEPDHTSALEAETKLDRVINSFFDKNLFLEHERFDCIFFNDVLEHLIDPEEALKEAVKHLKPNGRIIASIPNIRWYPVILSLLRYKDFKYENAGVMDKTHLRFFTKKSMVRLFQDSDLKVIKIEGINKHSFKFLNILNFFSFNIFEDMKYPQFAIQASIR